MSDQQVAPYGSWRSPIVAEWLADATVHLGEVTVDGDTVYWVETRPSEQGRSVVVRWTAAAGAVDVTPPGFSARTRAHEYGGGAYWVDEGTVYFANFPDQILYRQVQGHAPVPLTPAGYRYADGIVDRGRGRIICVREDHTVAGREAENTLVAIDTETGGAGEVIAGGHDFYASPALSPDGTRLCWLAWRHPNMPWTATELWLADVAPDGALHNARCIEGGQPAANRSSSRRGRPTGNSFSSPTARTGGISIAGSRTARSRWRRWMPSLACRSGSLASPPMHSSHRSRWFAPTSAMAAPALPCWTL